MSTNSDSEKLANFKEDQEIHERVMEKCEELGISFSEYHRKQNRRLLDIDDYNTPEAMLARASELENEADELQDEADDLEQKAELKRNDAERNLNEAEELRERARDTQPYEDAVEGLVAYLRSDDDARIFSDHKRVTEVADEHGESASKVIDDVKEMSGLPDARFQPLNTGDF